MSMTDLLLVETAMRGGACTLLTLIIVMILRDFGRLLVGRLAAAFALGTLAFIINQWPGLRDASGVWGLPILALSTANNVTFWLLACRLFNDDFELRPVYGLVWLAIVLLQLVNTLHLLAGGSASFLSELLIWQAPVFAILAAGQALVSWRGDLVEPRRRLRLFVIVSGTLYTVIEATHEAVSGTDRQGAALAPHLIGPAVLLFITFIISYRLMSVIGQKASEYKAAPSLTHPQKAYLSPSDQAQLDRLERLMRNERIYRQDRLTIGELAAKLKLPEYHLRRLINQGLDHRNFAAFVNGYRLEDVIEALSDPVQSEVSVLTIALDAGFSSLGPFNRAFKAHTGLTPSDYRKQHAIPASRFSKTA